MSLDETKDIKIFINMFVHYSQTYNAYTICNNFNKYFEQHKLTNSIKCPECFVMINSAPHSEEESIKIEICLNQKDVAFIQKDSIILNFKEFVTEYFNNQIKVISVEFIA